ncbi:MAG: slipin family protein [Spirochaetales bacterium]|nr:slipin family protein [Leptospiraceae bacterium]MCP5480058.1 slipin family protein [Spirochaetales bacterium]MCP5485601.1 slipin family protein [Spirochaetales bacterium]
MTLSLRRFDILPNTRAYLFRRHRFDRALEPGTYRFFDPSDSIRVYCLPSVEKQIVITNQEVLSKDNVAFRFSFLLDYIVEDGRALLEALHAPGGPDYVLPVAEEYIKNLTQIAIRDRMAEIESDLLNENRESLCNQAAALTNPALQSKGVRITAVRLRDLSFPKQVQDLFSKHLEARIRAKTDLESARSQVATARALKNAAELMKDDDNMRFLRLLETLERIASRGAHTFVLGDPPDSPLRKK